MHDPGQPLFGNFKLVIGILIGIAAGQAALASSEKPDAAQAVSLSGQQVYNAVCVACHSPPGIGGAPALGDSEAWGARLVQGMDTLNSRALNGFSGSTGIMPRKGGRLDFSDEEVIAAVEYMVEES